MNLIMSELMLLLYLSVASAMDLKWKRIENSYIILGICTGLCLSLMEGGGYMAVNRIMELKDTLPFLLLYILRITGAGDVKLLMACSCFIGSRRLMDSSIWMLFSAGISAAIFKLGNYKIRGRSYIPLGPSILMGFSAYLLKGLMEG